VVASLPAAPAAPAPSSLDVEIALLQDANGALREKDGARALRLVDEHSRRFPNGTLGEEFEAARVFALCQSGRMSEARDVAGRFLREHPRSPLVPRVSRACDSDPSTF
jgi:outer membrane protein assembly factor BamD (BamD/ComL family)